jgi:hypothetical protein
VFCKDEWTTEEKLVAAVHSVPYCVASESSAWAASRDKTSGVVSSEKEQRNTTARGVHLTTSNAVLTQAALHAQDAVRERLQEMVTHHVRDGLLDVKHAAAIEGDGRWCDVPPRIVKAKVEFGSPQSVHLTENSSSLV